MVINRSSNYYKKLESTSKLILLVALIASGFSPTSAGYLPTSGSINGAVMYYGNLAAGLTLYVCYFIDISGPPVDCVSILTPGGQYLIENVDPGSYYVSADIDANNSGGPPDPGEAIGYYDPNRDGERDLVVVGGGMLSGIDIAVNFSIVSEETTAPIIYYVDDGATGANDGTSWTDAFTSLQSALSAATISGTEIWIAAGTYKPGAAQANSFSKAKCRLRNT